MLYGYLPASAVHIDSDLQAPEISTLNDAPPEISTQDSVSEESEQVSGDEELFSESEVSSAASGTLNIRLFGQAMVFHKGPVQNYFDFDLTECQWSEIMYRLLNVFNNAESSIADLVESFRRNGDGRTDSSLLQGVMEREFANLMNEEGNEPEPSPPPSPKSSMPSCSSNDPIPVHETSSKSKAPRSKTKHVVAHDGDEGWTVLVKFNGGTRTFYNINPSTTLSAFKEFLRDKYSVAVKDQILSDASDNLLIRPVSS